MNKKLFNEFEKVSSKQWKQQIQFDLKGADYNDTVVWKSPEDIQVKPFYHCDESVSISDINTKATEFKIGQSIFVHNVEKSINNALDSIQRGAESLYFIIENEKTAIEKLLHSLPLEKVVVHFNLQFLSASFINTIEKIAADKNRKVYYNIDPIGHLAREGNWFNTEEKDNLETLHKLSNSISKSSVISIDASLYQNAGANMVQQIAYTVAHVTEYFNAIPTLNQPIVLQVAVGSNYFFEIAKLRALRLFFGVVAREFGHTLDCHIVASPSKRNKTIYDYNVNMLRTTSECMSAIFGGANTIINLPYDVLYHKTNEFGERISRNQLLILKKESHFDKVDNPADGSYYIESLTQQLTEKAMILFKDIEANGGFLKQLKEGTIKRKIQESANAEQKSFDEGKEVLLGTNKYPNKNDKMKHDLELFPFVKIKPRKTLITPIIEKRLAEQSEQERLSTEV